MPLAFTVQLGYFGVIRKVERMLKEFKKNNIVLEYIRVSWPIFGYYLKRCDKEIAS